MDCNIIPKVIDNNGNLVESKLFQDIWDKIKAEHGTSLESRSMAINEYKKAYSNEFINHFGDWQLLKAYNSDSLSMEQSNKLYEFYNGNIFYLQDSIGYKLDENGEPKVNYVLNEVIGVSKYKTQPVKHSLDFDSKKFNYNNIRHVNRILSRNLILHIDKFKDLTFEDFKVNNRSIKSELIEVLESTLADLQDSGKANLIQINNAFEILDELNKDNSYYWNRFVDYFNHVYKIDIIDPSSIDETDLIHRGLSFEDSLQLNIKQQDRVPNLVKFAISKIALENNETVTGLYEPLELTDVWSKLIISHRHDQGNPNRILNTLRHLGQVYNSGLFELADMLERDQDLMNAYISATDLAVPENTGIITRAYKQSYEVDYLVNNRHSFVENKIYDSWINKIINKYKGENYEQLIKTARELDVRRDEIIIALNMLNTYLNIDMSLEAVVSYISKADNPHDIKARKERVFSKINKVIQDVAKSKKEGAEEYVSDVKGDLMFLAKIQAPYSDMRSNLSYFNVENNIEQTAQNHSFLTSFFTKLNSPEDVKLAFEKYTLDPKFQFSNWLWNTNRETQVPNGIFNYILQDRTRTIDPRNPVNMMFVDNMKSSLYGGNKDLTENIGTTYESMLNLNWDLNVFLHSLFGSNFISSSDSGRIFQIQVPIIDILEEINDTASMIFDEDGNFKSITYSADSSSLYAKVSNPIKQEIEEFITARDAIFDIVNNKLKVKSKFTNKKNNHLHILHNPKHWDGKTILKNGVPTGKVFKFSNMTYIKDDKVITFDKHILDKGINLYTLSREEFHNLIPEFLGISLKQGIEQTITKFSPIKNHLFQISRHFDKQNLTPDEIIERRNENRLVKDDTDFKIKSTSFFINDFINRVEIDNYFLGNQNEYFNVIERNKRVSQAIKNKIKLSSVITNNDGTVSDITYNVLTVSDIKIESDIVPKLTSLINSTVGSFYKGLINIADSFSVITENELINRLKLAGRYNIYKEVIDDINDESKPFDPTKFKNHIESLKFFMYSRELDTGLYPQMISNQHKNSTIVLFKRFYKGNQLGELASEMENNNIQQLNFESARKVGGNIALTINEGVNFIKFPSDVFKYVKTFKYADLGFQVDSRSHIMDTKIKIGVQLAKLITNGLIFDKPIYSLSNKKITGKELFNHYHDLTSYGINESAMELLDEWGALTETGEVNTDLNGNIIVESSKVFDYLQNNIYGDTQNENLIRSIQDDIVKGYPNLPIYTPINYRKFISVLFARIKNKITDQKLPGIHATLIPDLFFNNSKDISVDTFKDISHIKYIDRIHDEVKAGKRTYELQTIKTTHDGKSIIKAEILINAWMSSMFSEGQLIDINSLSEEVRTMVGIRIPTEDKPSMFVVEVVGFLNNGASQAVFPKEFIIKTNWDFDLDTVFLYRYNVKLDSKGNYEKIEYTEDDANINERYYTHIHNLINKRGYSNDLALGVIEDTKFISDQAYQDFLVIVDKIAKPNHSELENKFFKELDKIDIPSITKNMKLFASSLSKENIKGFVDRFEYYHDFVIDKLEILDLRVEELDERGLENLWVNQQIQAYEYIINIIDKLLSKYKAPRKKIAKHFAEMQRIQTETWKNLKHNIIESYVTEYNLPTLNDFKKLPILAQNSKKARQNRMIEIFESILTNEAHYSQLMRPNKHDNITAVGDYINSLWGKNINNLNTNYYYHESILRNINMSTRELKGNSVFMDGLMSILGVTGATLNEKSAIYHAITKDHLPESLKNLSNDDIIKELSKLINGKIEYNKPKNAFFITEIGLANSKKMDWKDIHGVEIQEQTSETTSNILDAVKFLMGFNINNHTLGVFKLLSSQTVSYMFNGKPNRFVYPYMLTHQPIIVDLVNIISKEEMMNNIPKIYHIFSDIRRSYLTSLYKNLQDKFKSKLGVNSILERFDTDIKEGKDIWIDHPSNKKGNYKIFYKVLNDILSEEQLQYEQDNVYFLTPGELEAGIVNRNSDNTVQLVTQLQVLESFHNYYITANKLLNLAGALKFDKADTPTFNHTTKLLQALNNAILNRTELKDTLEMSTIPEVIQDEILATFDTIILPTDKIKFINTISEQYKNQFTFPLNTFYIQDKTVIEAIFPSLFGSTDTSAYPMMETYFKNNVMLGINVLSNLILFESNALANPAMGWRSLKNKILADNNLLGKDKVENRINDYIVAFSVRHIPFFNNYKGEEVVSNPSLAERERLFNINREFDNRDIASIPYIEFKQLSLTNKLRSLMNNEELVMSLLHPRDSGGIKGLRNLSYTNAHILRMIEIRDSKSFVNERGYSDILFIDGEVDLNYTRQSIIDMYIHTDPKIRDIAEDLIKYAYYYNGLTFGNNISKVIPVEVLYDNTFNEPHVPSDLAPGNYAQALRNAHENVLNGVEIADGFVEALHKAMWDNAHINPIAKPRYTTTRFGAIKLDLTKPTWNVTELELITKDTKKQFNVVIEPYSAVIQSEYSKRNYVIIPNKNGEKILYKRFNYYESISNQVTIYYPINRTLPFEFGETAIPKFKEGILSETEYINFITHNLVKSEEYANVLANREQQIKKKAIYFQNKNKVVSDDNVESVENSENIYLQLGNQTISNISNDINGGVKIVSNPNMFLPDQYKGNAVVAYKGAPKNKSFENPFHIDKSSTVKENVIKFIDFVINSDNEQAIWIRKQLKSGIFKGKPIYYGNTRATKNNEPSHATALDWLINSPNSPFNNITKTRHESDTLIKSTSIQEKILDPYTIISDRTDKHTYNAIDVISNLFYILKEKPEAKTLELRTVDTTKALKYLEDNIDNINLDKAIQAAYINASKLDTIVYSTLLQFKADDITSIEGMSKKLSDIFITAIKKVSSTLRKQNPKFSIDIEVIDSKLRLSDLAAVISNQADMTIYIGDKTNSLVDKIISNNISKHVNVRITNDINFELDKILRVLPKNNANTIMIVGDEYNSIRYSKEQVVNYVNKLIKGIKDNSLVYKFTGVVNDGIGNSLYNNHHASVELYRTTGREKELYSIILPSNTKYSIEVEEHTTVEEREISKTYSDLSKLNKQRDAILSSIINIFRTAKAYENKAFGEGKDIFDEAKKTIHDENIYKEVLKFNILSFVESLNLNVTTATFTRSHLEGLVRELEKVDIETLFGFSSDYSDRAEYVKKFRLAIDISNSLSYIENLGYMKGSPEAIEMDTDLIEQHDNYVDSLKTIDKEIDIIRNQLRSISDKYLHRLVMEWSRNPRFDTAFSRARDNKEVGWTDQQIIDDLHKLLTQNEDLSIAMMWADSAFDTGITFIDSILKEYFQSRDAKNRLVQNFHDEVTELIANTLKVDKLKVTKNSFAKERTSWFSKFIEPKYGNLLSKYNWGEYRDSFSKMNEKYYNLVNQVKILEEQSVENIIGESIEQRAKRVKRELSEAERLSKEASDLRINWFAENTNEEAIETYVFTKEEIELLQHKRNTLSDKQFDNYLSKRNLRIDRKLSTDENISILPIIPSDKYKSIQYERLTEDEKEFLFKFKNIISKLIDMTYPDRVMSEDFFPVAIDMTNVQALKMVLGIRSIEELEYYIGINEDVVYATKAPMMSVIEKFRQIKIRDKAYNESKDEYESNVVEEINSKFKLAGDNAYKSFSDIIKKNKENYRLNAEFTAQNKSYDPYNVMNQFINQTLNYRHLNQFENIFKSLIYIVGSNRFEAVSGTPLIDKLKSKLGSKKEIVTRKGKDTQAYERLKSFYEVLHDISNINTKFDQFLNVLKQYTSMTYMSMNVYGGIKNAMKGMHDMVMEGLAGEFIDSEHLKWALSNYPYLDLLSNIGNEYSSNLDTAIIKRHHELLELKNEKGFEMTEGDKVTHRILMSYNALYFANNVTEHFMQYVMFLAASKSHRIVNGRAMNFNEFVGDKRYEILSSILTPELKTKLDSHIKYMEGKKEYIGSDQEFITDWIRKNLSIDTISELSNEIKKRRTKFKTEFEKLETVYDQYTLKDGRAVLKDQSKFDNQQLADFERRVHKINHQLHGIYNMIDRNRIKQTMMGEALMVFRSWMRPNWNRYFGSRFNRTKFDEGLGVYQPGIYTTLFKFITAPKRDNRILLNRRKGVTAVEAVTKLMSDYSRYLRHLKIYYDILPEYEKAAIKRAIANLIMIMGVSISLIAIGTLVDEDEPSEDVPYIIPFLLYELNMIHSEITQFTPIGLIGMVSRTKQYVSATEKILLDLTKLTGNIFAYPFRDEEQRIYQAGPYKGEDRVWLGINKSVPIIRQYHKAKNVPIFTAWYKLHNPFIIN